MSLNAELKGFLNAFKTVDTMATNASRRDYYEQKAIGPNDPTNPKSEAGKWVLAQANPNAPVPYSGGLLHRAGQYVGRQIGTAPTMGEAYGGAAYPGAPSGGGAVPVGGSSYNEAALDVDPATQVQNDVDQESYAEGGEVDLDQPGPLPPQYPGSDVPIGQEPQVAPAPAEPAVPVPTTPPARVTSEGKGRRKALDDQTRTEAYDPDLDGPTGAIPLGAPNGAAPPQTSQGAVPVGQYAPQTTQSPDMQGDSAAGLSTNNGRSDLENALHGGMTFAQHTFHLGDPNDPHAQGGTKALFGGVGAATPDVVKAMDQHVNAGVPNDPNLYAVRRLEAIYRWYSQNGQTDKANKAVFELMQYSAGVASQWGARGVQQARSGDIPGAIQSVQEGYNHIPDGNHMQVQGNTATIIDKRTGQPVQQFQFTPEQVFNAAMGLNNRSLYWQVLAQRVGQTAKGAGRTQTPEQEELTRARIENVRARTSRLNRTPIRGAGGGGGGMSPAGQAIVDAINAEGGQGGGAASSPKGSMPAAAQATPVADPADTEMTQDDGDTGTNAGGKPTQADTVAPNSVLRLPGHEPKPGSAATPVTPAGNSDAANEGRLPQEGVLKGQLKLAPSTAPPMVKGVRPFAPGEGVKNPDGSWSSEISITTGKGEYPELNGGRATNIPSLWLVNGRPTRVSQDQAVKYAVQSGLKFQSFDSTEEADKAAGDRETQWQNTDLDKASSVPPLWQSGKPATDPALANPALASGSEPGPDTVPNVTVNFNGDSYEPMSKRGTPNAFDEPPPPPNPYAKYMADAAKLPPKERTAVTTLLKSKETAYNKDVAAYNLRKKQYEAGEGKRVDAEYKADLARQKEETKEALGYNIKPSDAKSIEADVGSAYDTALQAPATADAVKGWGDPGTMKRIAYSLAVRNKLPPDQALRLAGTLTTADPEAPFYRSYKAIGRDMLNNVVVHIPGEQPLHIEPHTYENIVKVIQSKGRTDQATKDAAAAAAAKPTPIQKLKEAGSAALRMMPPPTPEGRRIEGPRPPPTMLEKLSRGAQGLIRPNGPTDRESRTYVNDAIRG